MYICVIKFTDTTKRYGAAPTKQRPQKSRSIDYAIVVHTCWYSQWTSTKPSNAATVLVVFEKTKNAAHVKIASGKRCRGRVWFPCGNEDEVSAALNVRMSCCTLDMISWCLLKHRHTLTCEVKPGQRHIPTVSRSYHHNAFMYLCQCFPSIKTL